MREARPQRLPLLALLAAHSPRGHRRGEPGRPRPLPPLRRRSPRRRHQAGRHPLSLGFPVGAAREGRLAQSASRSAGSANYAGIVFQALGDRVDTFITFNEPFIDLLLMDLIAENVRDEPRDPSAGDQRRSTAARRRRCTTSSSPARSPIGEFRARGRKGTVGIAAAADRRPFPVDPREPGRRRRRRRLADALLQPLAARCRRSRAPTRRRDGGAAASYNPDFAVSDADLRHPAANPVDFVGVNFYAPAFVRARSGPCRSGSAGWTSTRTR